ncbi:MAG: Ku protein [Gemmataceae bacterium]
MPSRPSWQGFLKVNLISVPVKAYSANASAGDKIGFHLVHRECNSRIRYKKVCPIHGEVGNDEIAKAYEYSKGKYVIVEPDELDKLRTENDKAVAIDSFIPPDALDPMYLNGRTYYLIPDGKVAHKPYAVLQEVMAEQERYGIARLILSGREQLAVVRPVEGLLAMSPLNYAEAIKEPSAFAHDVKHPAVSAQERKLAESLIEASTTEKFDLGQYKDEYEEKLQKLIDAKVKGKQVVAPPAEEEPAVINLMDALRQSLRRVQAAPGKNGRRTTGKAASHRRAATGRRKTG